MPNFDRVLIPYGTPDHPVVRVISVIVILSAVCGLITYSLVTPYNINDYSFGDLLINYQGGYVRRGAIGEGLYRLYLSTGIQPYWPIVVMCSAAYALVCAFFIGKCDANRIAWWLALSIFLCGFQHNIIRRDYLLYLVLIGMLYCLRGDSRGKRWLAIFLMLVGIMIHEAFIFFALPLALLLLWRQRGGRIFALIMGVSAIGLFVVNSVYRGDTTVATAIYSSWADAVPDVQPDGVSSNSSIGALTWSLGFTVSNHLHSNFYNSTVLRLVPVFSIIGYCISYYFLTFMPFRFRAVSSRFDSGCQPVVSALILWVTLFMLPLFTVLSCDWGRLYQHMAVTVFATTFIIPSGRLKNLFGAGIIDVVTRVNHRVSIWFPPTHAVLVVLLLCFAIIPFGSEIDGYTASTILGKIVQCMRTVRLALLGQLM